MLLLSFARLMILQNSFNSITIPLLEDPRLPLAKRCESCRPMGMFRSKEDEFLLCYDGEFKDAPDNKIINNIYHRIWPLC